ncbi:hypothetical protein QUA20_18460 [Microcoleus sp. Pol7_A1]|uniref:hypothetical protein n=1 Tax=Microcoleus sp. Pol7_A1 TaxID=2818893 RepID=UPI002FCF7851
MNLQRFISGTGFCCSRSIASSVEHLTISRSSTTFLPDRRLKNRANPQNKGGDLDATVTAKFPYNYSHAQTPYPSPRAGIKSPGPPERRNVRSTICDPQTF